MTISDPNNRNAPSIRLGGNPQDRANLQARGMMIPNGMLVHGFLDFESPVEMDFVSLRYSRIGAFTSFQINCEFLYAEVGRFCSIADHVKVGPNSHPIDRITTSTCLSEEQFSWFSPTNVKYAHLDHKTTKIGHDVWIGTRAIIMGGLVIGTGSIIGANAVVTRNVPPYSIVGGSPARVIRRRFPDGIIERLLSIKPWLYDLRTAAMTDSDFVSPCDEASLDRLEIGIKSEQVPLLHTGATRVGQRSKGEWTLTQVKADWL